MPEEESIITETAKRMLIERILKEFVAHSEPASVTVNEAKRVVCVVFKDGSKQLVRCSPEDQFDPEIGVALAIARNQCGSKTRLRKLIAERARFVKEKKREQAAAE